MKIKTTSSHTREFLLMTATALLAIGLIVYFLYLVQTLAEKTNVVFGEETLQGSDTAAFDFTKYDELARKLYPGSTTVLSGYVKPAPVLPAATTTVATTTAPTSTSAAASTKK